MSKLHIEGKVAAKLNKLAIFVRHLLKLQYIFLLGNKKHVLIYLSFFFKGVIYHTKEEDVDSMTGDSTTCVKERTTMALQKSSNRHPQ